MNQSRSAAGSPASRLVEATLASVPPHSRRHLIRSMAMLGAAAALPTAIAAAPAAPGLAVAQSQDSPAGGELHLPFYPYGQTVVFDPHRAPNWGPFWVLYPYLWSGLLGFDENGAVVLDLAESFEPNETADVWTATIRPDVVFTSGTPVTAQSFVDSWLRALDPYQPAPMSTFMQLVEGYDAYLGGESTDIGFTVVDDQTIEIRLSQPFSSFPSYVATFGWALVDVAAIDDEEEVPLAVPGVGAWQITAFEEGQSFTFEPDESSQIPTVSGVERIVWHLYDGPGALDAALADFDSGTLAVADVPATMVEAVTGDASLGDLLVEIPSQSSTIAIGMDFLQEPFNDLRYRQAVAAAIDRETWINGLEAPEIVAAASMVPPVVAETSGYAPATAPEFSAETAASLLTDAGYDPEGDSAEIVYYQPATDTAVQLAIAQSLLAMIEENSGLVIRHDTSLTADQIAALQRDNGGRQFDILWWWTDSATASVLEHIGASHSPAMAGWFNWSPNLEGVDNQNPGEAAAAFDEAIATANSTTAEEEMNAAFQEAEQLLLDNAVYVPLGHWVQRYVQQPWLEGTRQGPWSGSIPVRLDEAVTFDPPIEPQ